MIQHLNVGNFSFQIELERLNAATDDINKLEVDLDVSDITSTHSNHLG
jgi:hypothetical protein